MDLYSNSQASSTSKMQSSNNFQESDFEKILYELTGIPNSFPKDLFTDKTTHTNTKSDSESDDELDFLIRGSPYENEHDGECSGKTCNKCFQCGKYKHQCSYCKWVFNRWECPNTKCVSKTFKPFDISDFQDSKDPLDFG